MTNAVNKSFTLVILFCQALWLPHTYAAKTPNCKQGTLIQGSVSLNQQPLAAQVQLLPTHPSTEGTMTSVQTVGGHFTLCARNFDPDTNHILKATSNDNSTAVLVTALPAGISSSSLMRLSINEWTTVASGVALAQFIETGQASIKTTSTNSLGLDNAFLMASVMVDPQIGTISEILSDKVYNLVNHQSSSDGIETFTTLAGLINLCNPKEGKKAQCKQFLSLSHNHWSSAPQNTWTAIASITRNPSLAYKDKNIIQHNSTTLYELVDSINPGYQPQLLSSPTAWTIPLIFKGDGHQLNGAGNMVFDEKGRLWIGNNAQNRYLDERVCPGKQLFRLDPFREPYNAPLFSSDGGGINGVGFGIGIHNNNLWASNYGFTGTDCDKKHDQKDSLSQFKIYDNLIETLKPQGWRRGPVWYPQGMTMDTFNARGNNYNVWTASCGNNKIIKYEIKRQQIAKVISSDDFQLKDKETETIFIDHPFDVATDSQGNLIATGNNSDNVVICSPLNHTATSTYACINSLNDTSSQSQPFKYPLGVAVDTNDYFWVSNSGLIRLPCGLQDDPINPDDLQDIGIHYWITQISPQTDARSNQRSSYQRHKGGGLSIPWGVDTDGSNNVWVANFAGGPLDDYHGRLSHFCGTNPDNKRQRSCPDGMATGDPISPSDTIHNRSVGGYQFDGLERNTSVKIDPSGNAWVTNNWKIVPKQTNPFANGMVVFVGIATPKPLTQSISTLNAQTQGLSAEQEAKKSSIQVQVE